MESLRANYRDEEEDDDSSNRTQCNGSIRPHSSSRQNPPHSPNTPTTATNHDHNDANGESEDAEENNNINGNNEDNDDCEDGDDAEQPTNLPIQPSSDETDEDEEEDPQAPKSQQPSNRPIQPSSDETDEEEEEDDDMTPARKKQKALSSITSPSASPATDAEALPSVDAAAENSTPAIARKPKKKKTKAVNVWTKSTSRKGKKKSKPGAANGQESAVLITPIPRFPDKSDDSPDMKICLSKVHKAEKVELSDDRLSAGSTKGYRMVRATRGVVEGAWFFEIKVVKLGETGHTRLGWSMEKGDLQAPVGYDGNSFGYRDVDGSKVHKALREKYGEEAYVEGDVVGCYINLPEGSLYAPKPPNLVWYKGQRYAYAADGKEDPPKVVPGSEITFFKNGVCQGVAFTDLHGGRYYPAASMYTLPNQPNCVVKFNFGPDFMFFPQDLGERPTPSPMIEVPYHGYDGRVVEGLAQNGISGEKKH